MSKHLDAFLKRNRELAEAALEAPWTTFQWEDGSQERSGMFNVACDSAEVVIVKDIPLNDASFIAASRTSLPLALELLSMACEALERADCHCTVAERLSGHLTGCWMPEIQEALAALEEKAKESL